MSDVKAMEEGVRVDGVATSLPARFSNTKKILAVALAIAVVVAIAVGVSVSKNRNENTSKSPVAKQPAADTASSIEKKPVADASPAATAATSSPAATEPTDVAPSSETTTPSDAGITDGIATTTSTTRLAAISPESIVQTYDSCEDMKADLTIVSRMVAKREIENFKQGYFQVVDESPLISGFSYGESAAGSAMASTTSAEGETSFGTNNQVDVVDEADVVQSNGVQVFAAYGPEIVVLDAETSTVTNRTRIPDYAGDCVNKLETVMDMLLLEERLIVIASTATFCTPTDEVTYTNSVIRALVYDTTNMALVSSDILPAGYITARAVGSNVHIVSSPSITWYDLTQNMDPYNLESRSPTTDLTLAEYDEIVTAEFDKHVTDFVARLIRDMDCTGMQKMTLLQNTDVELGFAALPSSIVSITSFAASNPSVTSTKSMMVPYNSLTVYSSLDHLVLAVQGYWMDGVVTEETYLIAYEYDGASVKPATLGRATGYLMNQFSMDQTTKDGVDYLRVATTSITEMVMNEDGYSYNMTRAPAAMVTVVQLDAAEGEMPVVGFINGLGASSEQITAVRFLGDRAYVVTTDLTNPLYTLDMSDPTNPQAVGEFAIAGYTNFIQPIGDDVVVGVGMGGNENGTTLGFGISAFNVSDIRKPVRVQSLDVSRKENATFSSSSVAQYSSKAWRFLADSQLLIVPVTESEYTVSPCDDPGAGGECYSSSGGYDGFRIFKIDLATGIDPTLTIKHASGDDFVEGCWTSFWMPPRSLVFGGDVMTLKGHTILSHDLTTLTEEANIVLDTNVQDCNPWSL